MYLFEQERLEKVSAQALLRGIDLSNSNCTLQGKGIDDMTPQEKFEAGKKGIGGSSVADLLGVGFKGESGPSILFDEKFLDAPRPIDAITQRLFDQGHFSETMIFEMVKEKIPNDWQLLLDKNRYIDNDRDYCYADFDGILVAPDGERFPLEIKSFKDFPGRTKPVSGVFGEGGILPHDHYVWQCRYYMHEMNSRASVLVALPMAEFDPAKLAFITIYRDFDKEDEMLDAIDDFWLEHVLKGTRPSFKVLSDEGLKSFVSGPTCQEPRAEKTIMFGNDSKDLLKEYVQLDRKIKEEQDESKARVKSMEQRMNAIEASLTEKMGDASKASIEFDGTNFVCSRYEKTGSARVNSKLLKKDYPDVYEKVITPGKTEMVFEINTQQKI